jgi:hypothetical protein
MNTADLRLALSPRGTKPVVRLDLLHHHFRHDFIEKCIQQIEIKCHMEDGLNPLEQLGATIIFDSAGVETVRNDTPIAQNIEVNNEGSTG